MRGENSTHERMIPRRESFTGAEDSTRGEDSTGSGSSRAPAKSSRLRKGSPARGSALG